MHTSSGIGEQDAITDDTDAAENYTKEPAHLFTIRHPSNGHIGHGADEVARDGKELNLCR